MEKFKELSSSKSLKDLKDIKNDKKDEDKIAIKQILKSYYLRLSSFILKFTNLITKISLIIILVKYFRKIKIMSFIFRIINYILFSILGIFMSDIYGLKEIIAQIEFHWMEYVNFIHQNKIYKFLVKIFNAVSDENKSEVIKNKSEVIEDKSKIIKHNFEIIKDNSEIKINNSEIPSNERELKDEKILHDKTSGGNEKENWFKLNKYFWIGISIVSLTLIYIYWDSINELIKNVKPDDSSSDGTTKPDFLDHKEEYERYFKEIESSQELYDLEVIRAHNKGKTVEYIDVENSKWEDSPITPKASSSKLPSSNPGVMLPISRRK